MVINPIVVVYIPIIRIPIKGGMTIPNIATFDHGTYINRLRELHGTGATAHLRSLLMSTGCLEDEKHAAQGGQKSGWSHEKRTPGYLLYIGDEILPN